MRAAIRKELESIEPLDALEREHREAALSWVDSGAPLFRTAKPATPPQHLVSYFAVVDGESILLVDHRNARLWLPPGGHVEQGEHPRETVVRETREELGFAPAHEIAAPLMVTCTTTVGSTAGHTDVSLWYVVNAPRSQAINYDEQEFAACRWFDLSEVPFDRTDPHLKRFIEKLCTNKQAFMSESSFVPGVATEGGAETGLHGAAWVGDIERARSLIAAGSDVNHIDSAGEPPMHGAAAGGHTAMVELLVSMGAKVNTQEAFGLTALHWAASHGGVETVRTLVALGADVSILDLHGRTPRDLAAARNASAVVQYFDGLAPDIPAGASRE